MKKGFNDFVHGIVGPIRKTWIEHCVFGRMFSPVFLKQDAKVLPGDWIDLARCAVIDTNRFCTEMVCE